MTHCEYHAKTSKTTATDAPAGAKPSTLQVELRTEQPGYSTSTSVAASNLTCAEGFDLALLRKKWPKAG